MTAPTANTFTWVESHPGQPLASRGATVTPGNNTYGSYATVFSPTPAESFGIWVEINSNAVSANARDTLVTIGIDNAGGTTFTDTILHLGAAAASPYNTAPGGGLRYFFPIYIASGASIGAKASVNNATVGTLSVAVRIATAPTKPWLVRCGTFVRTFGEVTATSSGTAVTPGVASEGAYVQLGSALADDLWYWQVAMGLNNTVESSLAQHIDLAIDNAGTKRLAIENQLILVLNTESAAMTSYGEHREAVVGETVWGRIQGSTTSPTGRSLLAYGVGGRKTLTVGTSEGNLTIDGANGTGKSVQIFAYDPDGAAEIVDTVTTDGTGLFNSTIIPDDGRVIFASFAGGGGDPPGRSLNEFPGAGPLDIAAGSSGSADVTAPVLTIVSQPTVSSDPLVVSLYDDTGLSTYSLTCKDRPDGKRLTIYNPLDGSGNDGFVHPFGGKSTVTGSGTSADPFIFTIYRRGRWPTGIDLDVVAQAVDTSGNEAHE